MHIFYAMCCYMLFQNKNIAKVLSEICDPHSKGNDAIPHNIAEPMFWICFNGNWNFNTHLYVILNFYDVTACQNWWRAWWNDQWLSVKNYHVMSFRSIVFIFDRSKCSCIHLCFDFNITIFSRSKDASLQMKEKDTDIFVIFSKICDFWWKIIIPSVLPLRILSLGQFYLIWQKAEGFLRQNH